MPPTGNASRAESIRTSAAALPLAGALFAVVFAARLAVDDPTEPILFLLVVPVALMAADMGLPGGILAAALASGLVVAWDQLADPRLSGVGFATRILVYIVTGTSVGLLTSRRRELEAETARWFENSRDLNCVADFEGKFVRVNRAFEDTLGYTAKELLATPYVAYVHRDDREQTNAASQALASGGTLLTDFENRYRAKDGTYRWFRWTASSDPERRLIYASARDVTAMKELQDELLERAQTDPLTGLFNRRHFEEEAERNLDLLRRYGHGGALFLLDVDRFKHVNDEHGHAAGDDALRLVAERIRARIRKSDTAGRIGGDEFAIFFPAMRRPDAESLATAFLLSLAESTQTSGRALSCSIGIAMHDGPESLSELLAAADAAMYEAKRAGGNRHVVRESGNEVHNR